jgi:hypothetical protein
MMESEMLTGGKGRSALKGIKIGGREIATEKPIDYSIASGDYIKDIIKTGLLDGDKETMDKIHNKQSDLYTVRVRPDVGVKAAYGGTPQSLVTKTVEWIQKEWKRNMKAKIRKLRK